MTISDQVQIVEMQITEVKGQLEENGKDHYLFKEAVRELATSVELLEESINDNGGGEAKEASVTSLPGRYSQAERLEVIHQNLSMQIAGGQVLCDLINFEDGDDPDPRYPGLPVLWKNTFNNLQEGCDDLKSCFTVRQREGAA